MVGRGVLVLCALVLGCAAVRVYMVPHSHQDAGWLLTMWEYYNPYDDGEGHLIGGVRDIWDGVIEMLAENPARRFIVVCCGHA